MKKIFLLLLILLSCMLVSCDETFTPLDKIHEYRIVVNPRSDGTLDMNYYLKWEVLEEGDGGVDFITVGVANRFVENIKGKTYNIKKIGYSSENGSTIRIDFKETYHEGDIFEVEFSFTQKRIFNLRENVVEYSFNPGWFEEIEVSKLIVLWNKDETTFDNADKEEVSYLKWETNLDFGETIDVNVKYNRNHFPNLNPKEDYSEQTDDPLIFIFIIGLLILVFAIIGIVSHLTSDRYQTCRGFSGHVSHYHFYFGRHHGYRKSGKEIVPPNVKNSGSGGRGGGCACACACACAGGGRAGCSRKDFNNYLNI